MYDSLIRRNVYIKENILDSTSMDIDMLIFHEGNISSKHQRYISKYSRLSGIKFISVQDDFKTRAFCKSNAYCHPTEYSEKFGYGYKCMCAFWMDGFFAYTQGYDYILRIDEDCMITRMDLIDLIQRMEDREFSYVAAMSFGRDSDACTVGLMRFIHDFCEEHGLDREKANIDNCPYTNLFLMRLAAYRDSRILMIFSKAVRDSDSIFINRWGDHVLWRAIISMHAGEQCYFDKRIAYYHASHSCMVSDGKSEPSEAMHPRMNMRTIQLALYGVSRKARSCFRFLKNIRNARQIMNALVNRKR